MPVEIKVTGAEQLARLGVELKAAGEEGKGFRRELLRNLRLASRPLIDKVKAAATDELPSGGGLNEFVASSKFAARNALSGRKVGSRLIAKKPGGSKGTHDLSRLDNGVARHPVYAHRDRWSNTRIKAGWWSKTLADAAPEVQAALMAAMEETALKLTKE